MQFFRDEAKADAASKEDGAADQPRDYLRDAQAWLTCADSRLFLGSVVVGLIATIAYLRYRSRMEKERLKDMKRQRQLFIYGISAATAITVLFFVIGGALMRGGGGGGLGFLGGGAGKGDKVGEAISGSSKVTASTPGSGGGDQKGDGSTHPSPFVSFPSRETLLFYLAIGILVIITFMSKYRKKSKHH